MKYSHYIMLTVFFLFSFSFGSVSLATEIAAPTVGTVISLPAPDKTGGKPLMQALAERQSIKKFSDKEISMQQVSDLLWATWGVNRPDGRHTAPTARNSQQIEVYVVIKNLPGICRYDPAKNELEYVLLGSYAKNIGDAPLTLLYVAPDDTLGAFHAGSLYQNAGLYCASVGLGNFVHIRFIDKLKTILKLPEGYAVLIAQSIGWPKQ